MDGFDQDEGASESDESAIAVLGFVAAHGDSPEAFQLADRLLDSGACLVEPSWEETGPVPGVLAVWNDRNNATPAAAARLAADLALVGDRGTRSDIRSDVERDLQLRGIGDLAAGQMEGNGQAVKVCLEVDFEENPPRERPRA